MVDTGKINRRKLSEDASILEARKTGRTFPEGIGYSAYYVEIDQEDAEQRLLSSSNASAGLFLLRHRNVEFSDKDSTPLIVSFVNSNGGVTHAPLYWLNDGTGWKIVLAELVEEVPENAPQQIFSPGLFMLLARFDPQLIAGDFKFVDVEATKEDSDSDISEEEYRHRTSKSLLDWYSKCKHENISTEEISVDDFSEFSGNLDELIGSDDLSDEEMEEDGSLIQIKGLSELSKQSKEAARVLADLENKIKQSDQEMASLKGKLEVLHLFSESENQIEDEQPGQTAIMAPGLNTALVKTQQILLSIGLTKEEIERMPLLLTATTACDERSESKLEEVESAIQSALDHLISWSPSNPGIEEKKDSEEGQNHQTSKQSEGSTDNDSQAEYEADDIQIDSLAHSRLAQLGLFEQQTESKSAVAATRHLFEGLGDVMPTNPVIPVREGDERSTRSLTRQPLLPGTHDLTYKVFLQCLMRPQCTTFVRGMRLFLLSVTGPNGDGTPPPEDQQLGYIFYGTHELPARCSDFFKQLSEAMETQKVFTEAFRDHPPFSVRNGLEKYVMTKLYDLAFPLVSDPEKDKALQRQMRLLSFLTPSNLDVNQAIQNEAVLSIAQDELRKINNHRAPGDKISCVVRCCSVIFTVLDLAKTNGKRAGADEFLPVFIYVVLKANVAHLYSNCEYIEKFRNPHDMISRSGYCFVNLRSAIEFLLNVDASLLNIDSLEFARKFQEQELKLRQDEAS